MNSIHFESIDSTNTYLKENYQTLDNFTFVSADLQTKGRGRNNRDWKSEKGDSLLFSLLIKEEALIDKYASLSIISAYSLLEVFKEYGLNDLSIKWPNDVYVSGKKILGILLEAVTIEKIECLIIGIGINVNQDKFIGEYNTTPTSLYLETHKTIDIDELKDKVYRQIEHNFNLVKQGRDFYDEIIKYDFLKDKEEYAIINNEKKKVKILGINKDYSLKIEVDNNIMNINSGEITFHV